MKLAVGFITYNDSTAPYLADFLPSLEAALNFLPVTDYEVYAFDNSTNGHSANRSGIQAFNEQGARRPIKILTQDINLGFSRSYNIMINVALEAQAEYFLVINPDTLIEPEAIRELTICLNRDANLAAVTPKILRWDFIKRKKTQTIDSLGIIIKTGLRFSDLGQGALDDGRWDNAKIFGPSGAAALFRLSALIAVSELPKDGGRQYFDENFFMYKEDCDLAYRLSSAGYCSILAPKALVYHDRTAVSSGSGFFRMLSDRRKKSRIIRAWSFRNQHLIFVKHWRTQNVFSRIIIVFRILFMFIFSLIFEQFLLKEYNNVWSDSQPLTNIK